MRAAWYTRFGAAAEVLEVGEVEDPTPGPGQVRVRVACSGINPVDIKRRHGGRGNMPAPRVIPHFDGAGIIDAVGPDVDEGRVGHRVWVYDGNWKQFTGTAAEWLCLPAVRAVDLPDDVDFATGACLGIPAMTAHRCVFADGPVEGQTVLVTGGAGAVGSYAVQFAKLGGAQVIATISGGGKARRARECGADHVVNYRTEDVAARVREITGGRGADRIVEVDFGGNLETSIAALKANGVIAAYASDSALEPAVPFYRLVYRNITVHHVLVLDMPDAAKDQAVADITKWLAAGRLTHLVGQRFALDDIVAAHEAMEGGAYGKVLIDFPGV